MTEDKHSMDHAETSPDQVAKVCFLDHRAFYVGFCRGSIDS